MRNGYFSREQQLVSVKNGKIEKRDNTRSPGRHDSHLYATLDGEGVVLVTTIAALDAAPGYFDDMLDLGPVGDWVASFREGDAKAPEFPVILDRRWASALLDGNVPPDVLEAGRLAADGIAVQVHFPQPGTSP